MINWGSAPDPVPTRLSIAFEVEPVCSEFLADRKNLLADLSLANYYLINDPDLVVARLWIVNESFVGMSMGSARTMKRELSCSSSP